MESFEGINGLWDEGKKGLRCFLCFRKTEVLYSINSIINISEVFGKCKISILDAMSELLLDNVPAPMFKQICKSCCKVFLQFYTIISKYKIYMRILSTFCDDVYGGINKKSSRKSINQENKVIKCIININLLENLVDTDEICTLDITHEHYETNSVNNEDSDEINSMCIYKNGESYSHNGKEKYNLNSADLKEQNSEGNKGEKVNTNNINSEKQNVSNSAIINELNKPNRVNIAEQDFSNRMNIDVQHKLSIDKILSQNKFEKRNKYINNFDNEVMSIDSEMQSVDNEFDSELQSDSNECGSEFQDDISLFDKELRNFNVNRMLMELQGVNHELSKNNDGTNDKIETQQNNSDETKKENNNIEFDKNIAFIEEDQNNEERAICVSNNNEMNINNMCYNQNIKQDQNKVSNNDVEVHNVDEEIEIQSSVNKFENNIEILAIYFDPVDDKFDCKSRKDKNIKKQFIDLNQNNKGLEGNDAIYNNENILKEIKDSILDVNCKNKFLSQVNNNVDEKVQSIEENKINNNIDVNCKNNIVNNVINDADQNVQNVDNIVNYKALESEENNKNKHVSSFNDEHDHEKIEGQNDYDKMGFQKQNINIIVTVKGSDNDSEMQTVDNNHNKECKSFTSIESIEAPNLNNEISVQDDNSFKDTQQENNIYKAIDFNSILKKQIILIESNYEKNVEHENIEVVENQKSNNNVKSNYLQKADEITDGCASTISSNEKIQKQEKTLNCNDFNKEMSILKQMLSGSNTQEKQSIEKERINTEKEEININDIEINAQDRKCDTVRIQGASTEAIEILKQNIDKRKTAAVKKPCINKKKILKPKNANKKINILEDTVFNGKKKQKVIVVPENNDERCTVDNNDVTNDKIEDKPIYTKAVVPLQHINIYKQYKCEKCDISFIDHNDLNLHTEKIHTKDLAITLFDCEMNDSNKPFHCDECTIHFFEEKDLKTHKDSVHYNEPKSMLCEVCGKECNSSKVLKQHTLKHSKKKCPHCSKTLLTSSYFQKHVLSHSSGFYKCNDCHFKSTNKTSLEAHINKVHNKMRPYKCKICKRGFYRNSHLIEHKLVHESVEKRRLKCKICHMDFIKKKCLDDHMRLHTGERPYNCHYCEEKFVTASRRLAHMRRKHLEKSQKCNLCDRVFSIRTDLNRHVKTVHNIKKKIG